MGLQGLWAFRAYWPTELKGLEGLWAYRAQGPTVGLQSLWAYIQGRMISGHITVPQGLQDRTISEEKKCETKLRKFYIFTSYFSHFTAAQSCMRYNNSPTVS